MVMKRSKVSRAHAGSSGPYLTNVVLAGYSGEETWSEKEETQVRRKIDLRLMPILCITYGLQYYDKAMLSQAVSISSVQSLLDILTNACPGTFRAAR